MDKKQLRREIKSAIMALSERQKSEQSAHVVQAVEAIVRERKPRVLALFSPLNDEVDVRALLYLTGCKIVLPRIVNDGSDIAQMEFFEYSSSELCRGAYGIMEPQAERAYGAGEIDLMVVPGVAFTVEGERMGRGKGYYDRYLSREGFRAYCVGVCFGCQICDKLPVEPHDRRMNEVIKGC